LDLQRLFKAEITLAARQELGDTPQRRRLNRIVCVATGARRSAAVELEVFEVK
jgi:hypothetical protein